MINRMGDKEFEGDPLDYTALFVEARRSRESERVLMLENDGLKVIKILQDNKLEKLEKENVWLKTILEVYDEERNIKSN